jgi:predicted Zn-dependent protease
VRALIAIATVALLTLVGGAPVGESAAGRGIALIPLTDFPAAETQAIAAMIQRRYSVMVVVLPPLNVPAGAYDPTRRQFRSEDVASAVLQQRSRLPVGVSAGIALTSRDLYTPSAGFAWAFAFRSPTKALYVISTARTDPKFFGLHSDPEIAESRLSKLIARAVGLISLERPYSDNPRSAVTKSLESMDDLDFMTNTFAPASSAAQRRWLAVTANLCARGANDVAAASLKRPTTRGEALRRLRTVIALEDRWFPRFKRPVAAPPDRFEATELKDVLDRLVELDRKALANLSSNWSDMSYRRFLVDDGSVGNRSISLALDLGSKPCGHFLEAI